MELTTNTFDTLWDQTHQRICRFVCSRVSNDQDAEDILQDVFLRIYHQLNTVHEDRRLESWMYQIARNRIIDHYRSRRQWVELSETLAEDEDAAEETMEDLLSSLRQAIASLPESYREALVQADLQGIAQQDLAVKLGISLPGAKSRVQRARQKVKEAILRCFDFEFDPRGQIVDYRQHCCC